jgi:hypothetical protein
MNIGMLKAGLGVWGGLRNLKDSERGHEILQGKDCQ